jgi:leader peptidase (prepilin peptidase)/N-methyltransferase
VTAYLQEPVTSVIVTLVGLVFGSFLNVCIYRLPLGKSVVYPRSRCPSCETPISALQNVPVLSWVFLRGRCASCAAPISWRYPAVELLSGAVALITWRAYGPSAAFLIATPYTLAMIVLFFTDWDHKLLPDAVTLTGFVGGMAVAWFNPFLGEPGWSRIWQAAAGAAVGAGFLWGVGKLYTRLRGVEAMGMGDVKMMAFVGTFSGPQGVLFTIFAGSVVGAVVGVSMIRLRGGSMKDTLPFGCFLAPAAVAALHFGRPVVEWYLRLVVPGT